MENQNHSPSKGCLVFWLSFIAGYVFQFLALCVVVSVFKSLNLNTSSENLLSNIYVNLVIYLAMYGAMLMICLLRNKPKLQVFKKPSLLKILIYTGISIVLFFMLNPIVSCFSYWFIKLGLKSTTLSFKLTTGNYFIALIFLVALPATVEELLFRGLIFTNMSKQGKTFATIMTSLMFSLFHSSIFQTIYPILFSLLLCVIMLREENIYYCMIAHAVNNLLALTSEFYGWKMFSSKIWFIVLSFVLAIIYLATIIYTLLKTRQKQQAKQALTSKDKISLVATFVVLIIIWICSSFLA